MTVSLRVLLIVASVFTLCYITRKLRKAEIGLMDTCFWIFLTIIFVLLSIFPEIAMWGANVFGFMSSVNFIFLLIIFLLLIRNFLLTVRIAKLEDRFQKLVEELAIRANRKEKEEDNE